MYKIVTLYAQMSGWVYSKDLIKNATLFSVTMCSDADADNSGVVPGDRVSTQQPGLL